MARPPEPTFPKTRHVALDLGDGTPLADAILVSTGPAVAVAQPEGVPEGALGQAAPQTPLAAGAPEAAGEEGAPAPIQPPPPLIAQIACVDIGTAAGAPDRCARRDGTPADVRCPSSLEGRVVAAEESARAARTGDAILLAGIDRWYRMGSDTVGFCRSCELALVEFLREGYGDHLQKFDPLEAIRTSSLPPLERPFARQREVLRLSETLEAAKRAILRARDEARRERGLEIAVLGRAGAIGAASLSLCRHLDGLVFDLPSLEPMDAVLPLLAARAALGQRPAVAVLPAAVSATQVRQFAALATACDADLALERGASAEAKAALADHRRFHATIRERYRPAEPLAEAELLLSPSCDHWTFGAHQIAAAQALSAAAATQLQTAIRLDLAGGTSAQLLILAGAAAISKADAAAARRHLEGGKDLLLLGHCATIDEEGRPGEPVFPEADEDEIERVGEGRLYFVSEPAEAKLVRGLRELIGRGRAQVTVAGRGRLFARAYLDPEKKLDVHLVNLDAKLSLAQGVQLTIAAQVAGGGRSGYWFAPDRSSGKDGERIPLNPSGFSVSTILPSVSAYALLTVPR